MNSPEIITVGHILKEYIHFPEREIGPVLGSPAAYSAVTASRLGMHTGLVTRIGEDMPAELLRPLFEAGVDGRGIKTEGESTSTTILSYDASGNKQVRYEKSAPQIEFKDIPPEYLAAKAALLCPMNFEVPLECTRALYEHGLLLMADLGGFGGTVSVHHPHSKHPQDQGFLVELSKNCQVIKASLEDCQYLFGPVESEEEAGGLMAGLGVQAAIVSLGDRGSVVFEGGERHHVPAFPSAVVYATGAGDAYCGSFLVEYLRTGDIEKAAFFASAAASIMIESSGGVTTSRMPTTDQVRERLRDSSIDIS
jgi:sugar/nucleoside kinase (ribokinase family)